MTKVQYGNKIIENGRVTDLETGETMTSGEYLNYSKQLIEQERAFRKVISKENGVVDKKDTHYFNWNNKNNPTLFTKSYKVFQREVLESMDISEVGLMSIFTMYLESETNRVVINQKNPSNKDLETLAKIGNSKLKSMLQTLREKNLIVTTGRGLGREIYVNPLYAFDGKDIKKDTLDMFNIEY